MIQRLLAALLVLSTTATLADAGDRDALVGTWKITVFQDDGRDRLERLGAGSAKKKGAEPRVAHLVFDATGCWVLRGDGKREVRAGLANAAWKSVTLDESTQPKSVDVTGFAGKDGTKEKVYVGVYSLDGNTLKIAWAESGSKRPTELVSDGANNLFVAEKVSDELRKPAE